MDAAAYARYSTDQQTENSIAYQLTEIRKYCKINNINLTAVYIDEAQSGTNTERKGFQGLLTAARRHDFEAVVIYDITRGSRDVGDWFTFRKEMMMIGIKVISTAQKLGDMTNGNDFLMELLTAGMGQVEVLNTRQKSIAGRNQKAKEGAFLGGSPPLGYDVKDGKYVINETEAHIVRKIFDMYAQGIGYNLILDELQGACGKYGRPLGKNSLHCILKNERYIGVYSWNQKIVKRFRKWAGGLPNPDGVKIEGAIPPIIEIETWERVQKRMADKTRRATNKAKRTYLLTGLIECTECGATYVGHTSTKTGKTDIAYYVCGNRYRTHQCGSKSIRADVIEPYVISALKQYLATVDFEETARVIADQINNASPDLSKEKKELADAERKIKNGMNAILNGADFSELQEEITRLRVRKSELQEVIAAKSAYTVHVEASEMEQLLRETAMALNAANIADAIKVFVTKIYAYPNGSFDVNIGVHIDNCGSRQYVVCATFTYTPE